MNNIFQKAAEVVESDCESGSESQVQEKQKKPKPDKDFTKLFRLLKESVKTNVGELAKESKIEKEIEAIEKGNYRKLKSLPTKKRKIYITEFGKQVSQVMGVKNNNKLRIKIAIGRLIEQESKNKTSQKEIYAMLNENRLKFTESLFRRFLKMYKFAVKYPCIKRSSLPSTWFRDNAEFLLKKLDEK